MLGNNGNDGSAVCGAPWYLGDSRQDGVITISDGCEYNQATRYRNDSTLVVRAPFNYPPNTTVIFTLEGVTYAVSPGQTMDLSQVTLWDKSPISWNNGTGEISYFATFNGGDSYVLSAGTVKWPASDGTPSNGLWNYFDPPGTGTVTFTGSQLSFWGFHNCLPEITVPIGSADGNGDNAKAWLTGPARFDFQGVACNNPGGYTLNISGGICSGIATKWTLTPASAGTLTYEATPTPTYDPPNSLSGDPAKPVVGTLDLDGMTQKKVLMYKDHLARDMDNFAAAKDRTDFPWTFTAFGYTGTIDHRWNCHGSVQHAHDGTGNGKASFPEAMYALGINLNQPFAVLNYPFTDPILRNLQRGDIVAIHYVGNNSENYPQAPWFHSATAIGGSMIWGANNSIRDNGTETWHFASRPVYRVIMAYYKNYSHYIDVYIFRPGAP